MNSARIIFQEKWITVKQTPRGFQYLERKGKDSVAIFLLRKSVKDLEQYEVLIRQQPLCIDETEMDGMLKLFACTIMGAIDKRKSPEKSANQKGYTG
ncbi:hypothetical protein JOY44_16840 [Phormidium sp. CLA17]|uniref:hypothetical protein n=1 Tax=Leptolyngbya sp. Cla-17 TaxID=2803751 RepID=UPI0014908BBE|nr:hypothetical protein [Leptolyngbya sp. Cla-17]MBM0743258.1 hypothetical protein [Leptolyngbya sp. Cla-17]